MTATSTPRRSSSSASGALTCSSWRMKRSGIILSTCTATSSASSAARGGRHVTANGSTPCCCRRARAPRSRSWPTTRATGCSIATCSSTMAMLGGGLRQMGSDADAVQGLFVTVDPKRDMPEILSQYVPSFYPSFLGLYGDEAATAHAAQEFKAYFHANPPDERGSYTVDHSSQLYVIDPTGRLRLYIKTDAMTPDSIAHDLRGLLREARG